MRLLKLLGVVTPALRFVAAAMLLGGLVIAASPSLLRGFLHTLVTLRVPARRLTILMVFVITAGVSLLLCAQSLHGRAFYTSSVLIGLFWIALVSTPLSVCGLGHQFSVSLDAG